MVKMSKIEEKIRSSKILKDLDEETIDGIKTIVASSDNYKDKVCKKLLEETTEMCFKETERLFEPYIDCHKNVHDILTDIRLLVPKIEIEGDLLINIHEYYHALELFNELGTIYESKTEEREKRAKEIEKNYIKNKSI